MIYEEQEVSECYYFILKGSVVVRRRYGDGGTHSKQLQRYNAGNSFGENGLSKYAMTGGKEELHNVSTTTTVTVEDCEFLILPKMQYQHCANSFQEKHLEARMNVLKLSPGKWWLCYTDLELWSNIRSVKKKNCQQYTINKIKKEQLPKNRIVKTNNSEQHCHILLLSI